MNLVLQVKHRSTPIACFFLLYFSFFVQSFGSILRSRVKTEKLHAVTVGPLPMSNPEYYAKLPHYERPQI
jgi:hypothetical protein